MLSLWMKDDNESTLMTTCPLEHAFLSDANQDPDAPKESLAIRLVKAPFRFFVCLVLQILTNCRTLLLPIMAGMGTTGCFVASKNCQVCGSPGLSESPL